MTLARVNRHAHYTRLKRGIINVTPRTVALSGVMLRHLVDWARQFGPRSLEIRMNNVSFVVMLALLLGSVATAEDQNDQAEPRKKETRQDTDRARRRYGRNPLEVKDPAHFRKSQDAPLFSGPQIGEKLPDLEVKGIYGKDSGQTIDVLRLAGENPHLLILMDDGGVALRGLYGLTRLVSTINEKAESDLHITVAFLADDPDAVAQRFAGLARALGDRELFVAGVAPGGRDGPGTYGLNRNVAQTMIFAKEGQVTRNFVFSQGMLSPDAHVLGAVAEIIGEERPTVAGWLKEANNVGDRMQRDRMAGGAEVRARMRALRTKLRELVEAGKINREEAGEVFQAAFPQDTGPQQRAR